MEQKKIDRINELSRKARTPEGLTPAEMEERQLLREEYVRAVVGNLDAQLSHTVIVDEKTGARRKLRKRDGE
ncbi:DUF896 domain-containing protein [Oscillibacter hominis]|uniref:UPF0291 protein H8790_08580 n=1 Tax=Oscillibacter hominis TaxID=2763056 RepID=A0A7G9B1V5_9FIRM|nr:DUF896 domain-containing protein [Oscillibacter hominis]QNL43536.1 DUF896 domain-containing protein [Oscillibacter hominis]